MATRAKRGETTKRPVDGRAGTVATGVVHLVKSTFVTALVGARDVGAEVGQVAVGVMRGSIRAVGEIGGDVARLAVNAAEGAIDAADRITTAAGRAANNLVDATLTGVAGIGRRPAERIAGRGEPAAAPTHDSDGRSRPAKGAGRKPLGRSPSRIAPAASRSRRRRGAA